MRRGRALGLAMLVSLAAYGAVHLVCTGVDLWTGRGTGGRFPSPPSRSIPAERQALASAVTRILAEDGIPEAPRWAAAIVCAVPSDDLGYVALVLAQIRRESHFLAPDLEWLFDRLVPDRLHEVGLADPVTTVGPMQVKRWTLQTLFERAHGRRLDAREVKQLASTPESGVAACIAALDRLVVDHLPDRRIEGWVDRVGGLGLDAGPAVCAQDWPAEPGSPGRRNALAQKILSDLVGRPLALDGLIATRSLQVAEESLALFDGARRERAARSLEELAAQDVDDRDLLGSALGRELRARWESIWGPSPSELAPSVAHEARLAFVLSDFHVGAGASRTAALQALLAELLDEPLEADGIRGPRTRAAMGRLFHRLVDDARRRDDFLRLLAEGRKLDWVARQATELARAEWERTRGGAAPEALVPDLWHDGFTQRVKGLGRISVVGYVSGSVAAFEDYLLRLRVFTGRRAPWRDGAQPLRFRD